MYISGFHTLLASLNQFNPVYKLMQLKSLFIKHFSYNSYAKSFIGFRQKNIYTYMLPNYRKCVDRLSNMHLVKFTQINFSHRNICNSEHILDLKDKQPYSNVSVSSLVHVFYYYECLQANLLLWWSSSWVYPVVKNKRHVCRLVVSNNLIAASQMWECFLCKKKCFHWSMPICS